MRSSPVARRLFDLTEPIPLVNFFAEEPNESMAELGLDNYWDGYFAGRSAPLGRCRPRWSTRRSTASPTAESCGRIHHLPKARLADVMDGLRDRGLLDDSGRMTGAGRATRDRVESLTDALAEAPYQALQPSELAELVTLLEPISGRLQASGSR